MREIRDDPILTDTFDPAGTFRPVSNSIYLFEHSLEQRSAHVDAWRYTVSHTDFIEIKSEDQNSFQVLGDSENYLLRSETGLARLWKNTASRTQIYIDITGLTHSVWAALLRSALTTQLDVAVVYVEPDQYRRSEAPVEGQIYDLSTRISGIAPLPGFAILSERSNQDFVFIPFLGFEGTRLKYLIEQIQPGNDRIIPVIGLPGFKPWYVFETYLGNKRALLETAAWHSVEYVPANCPFSCYYLLEHLAQEFPTSALKIAPIGTKPHALGAVLFALANDRTELVYDHPIRKTGRTDGTSRLLVYHVSSLVSGAPRLVRDHASRLTRRREARRR